MAHKRVIFRLGELFSGPGGMALGAIQSSSKSKGVELTISHEWANDFDQDTCMTFEKNIAKGKPGSVYCQDVRELNIWRLAKIDAFAYGFPCNDFSIVGERKGFNGDFGPLYTYGIKVLNHHKPKFFVAENVGGITSANEGTAFKKILKDLSNAGNGYRLTVHLYKSEDYGVPQTRHRIVIVGIDQAFNLEFKVPRPTSASKYISASEALANIPNNAENNEITRQSKLVVERLKQIKPGENVWTAKLPKELQINAKGARLSQIYKRLDPSKPSYTITGSGGGGTHGYHWDEPRALTNRERARIQTFPDNFIFLGSKESVRKQIGMAVPVELSRQIFTAILNTFSGVPYEFIDANFDENYNKIINNYINKSKSAAIFNSNQLSLDFEEN